jgi:hypothetical protein
MPFRHASDETLKFGRTKNLSVKLDELKEEAGFKSGYQHYPPPYGTELSRFSAKACL